MAGDGCVPRAERTAESANSHRPGLGAAHSRDADPDRGLTDGVGESAGARHRRLGRHGSQLLEDDEVRSALSVYVVDQLYTNGDVKGRLKTWLGVLALGGLAALGFEVFRRRAVGELEPVP